MLDRHAIGNSRRGRAGRGLDAVFEYGIEWIGIGNDDASGRNADLFTLSRDSKVIFKSKMQRGREG